MENYIENEPFSLNNEKIVEKDMPITISDEVTERLAYQVNKINDNEGTMSLSWEKVSIKFNFKVNQ